MSTERKNNHRGAGKRRANPDGSRRYRRNNSFVGKWGKHVSNPAQEFLKLATADEAAGRDLLAHGHHRQATYFFVQAMEKLVRFGIYSQAVAGDLDGDRLSIRERTRSHNLDELLAVLLEVFAEAINDSRVSAQIEKQLNSYVLQGVRFGHLHNNIRYPLCVPRTDAFTVLDISEGDSGKILQKLERLKSFVAGFNKLKDGTSPLDELVDGEKISPEGAGKSQAESPNKTPTEKQSPSDREDASKGTLSDFRF